MDSVSFKGVYKVTIPNVKEMKDEKEKTAVSEAAVGAIVLGANSSIEAPRTDNKSSIYFKIDNKNDSSFEKGFANILSECNKQFNIDVAKKVYLEKVSDAEFQKAQVLQ
ncbi:hypothetical protein IJO12_02605 [bacterium]|nr:hypothetical protein [bacterium]